MAGVFAYLEGFGASGGGAGGTLTVTAPANITVTISKDGKTKAKNSGTSGVAVFKGLEAGTWTVTITGDGKTARKTVTITTDYSTAISFNAIPEFTYTGDFEIVNDSDEVITVSQDNWKIRFLTSGTLTFTNLNGAENGIDVFLVGGGGNGGTRNWNPDSNIYCHGAGGGSGYTTTEKGVTLTTGTEYQIEIGAATGSTSAFSLSASGGKSAGTASRGWQNGGNGASGGGATDGVGGTDGGNGTAPRYGTAGTGQGTTTREFGEENGRLYASGGNGNKTNPTVANSGNGADGRTTDDSSTSVNPGASGIVVIRNKR